MGGCDSTGAVLVAGISAIAYLAAELTLVAQRQGAGVIEINPESDSTFSDYHGCWIERAGAALPGAGQTVGANGIK